VATPGAQEVLLGGADVSRGSAPTLRSGRAAKRRGLSIAPKIAVGDGPFEGGTEVIDVLADRAA
jgi:hypothetical protein